jgi:hypothetical protein
MPLTLLGACEQTQPTELAPRSLALSAARPVAPVAPTTSVFATGLSNPRGIAFGPDGALYVAEAGTGGTTSTVGQCVQDPNPSKSGPTGKITRIEAGQKTTVVSGLPSSVNTLGSVFGIADLAFVGPKLYGLLDAGCGHGVPNIPASVIQVANGGWSIAANLSAWVAANPVAHFGPDVEPDGDWYSMTAVGGVLFAVDANGGQLVSIKPNSGKIDRVIDISASQGHIVPTVAVEFEGDFYIGNLQTFPAVTGASKILRTKRNGKDLEFVTAGYTAILGADIDKQGRGYTLESFQCVAGFPCVPGPFAAGTGRVTRYNLDGSRDVIATGLTFPTSLRFGPDGALYVSNKGYNQAPGSGEIIRIALQ